MGDQTSNLPDGFHGPVEVRKAAEWAELLRQFDDASLYQTWSYGTVHWTEGQMQRWALYQGARLVSMVQVRVVRFPLLQRGVAYVRWGPLFRLRGQPCDVQALQQMVNALKQEYVERRQLLLRLIPAVFDGDPFANSMRSLWKNVGLAENASLRRYRTLRVELTASLEDLRRRLNQKWRNCLNSAERNGLDVIQGTGLDLYDKFLGVYQEMMARKQFETSVSVTEFRTLQEALPEPQKMQVLLCEKEGRILNGMVMSAVGDTAIYLLGATSAEGLSSKGAYLLQWRAMQWLKERGCRWYDLGGINLERNPGVHHFKSGLGGEETCQLGTFDLSANWLSSVSVRAAEQFQSIQRKFASPWRSLRLCVFPMKRNGAQAT